MKIVDARSSPGMTAKQAEALNPHLNDQDDGSARIPQPGRNAVDGELNSAQHPLVQVLCAMHFQKLHLNMVERIEIGKAMAHRALQQSVALQEPLLPHDVEKRPDDELPLMADTAEDLSPQLLVRHQISVARGDRDRALGQH